jgi:hypothetical protein
MRKHGSGQYSGLIVAALMLASGCSRPEEPAVLESPESASGGSAPAPIAEPIPDPVLDPSRQGLVVVGGQVLRTGTKDDNDIGHVPTAVMRRLVYQCSDEVTFAVRIAGNKLEVFPPGIDKSYVTLTRMPTEVGVRYVAMGADFRGNGDLATLQVGDDRYVDCVSNPAAEVWGTVQPTATR